MLTDVAVVLVVTLVACGLVVLGVLELVWPTRRRVPLRPPATRPRPTTRVEEAASAPVMTTSHDVAVDDPPSEIAADESDLEPRPGFPGGWEARPPEARASAGPGGVGGPVRSPHDDQIGGPSRPPMVSALERCEALAAEEEWDRVRAIATPVLEATDREAVPEPDRARLWSLLARAHAERSDHAAAVAAFRSAIASAPDEERGGYRRDLVASATAAARALVTQSTDMAEDAARLEALRSARALLAAARAEGPEDPSVALTLARVDQHYWPVLEETARRLSVDDAAQGYQIAGEALADASLPETHRAAFEALRAETLAGQIDGLAAAAERSIAVGRDWDAVAALDRAEALMRSTRELPTEPLARIAGQLADTLTRLGTRRVEGREFEDAIEPLLRALRLPGLDTTRADGARWALAQAIEGLVEARTSMIREVAGEGHRASAIAQAEKLWGIVRNSIAAGVPQERLQRVQVTVRELMEDLGQSPS